MGTTVTLETIGVGGVPYNVRPVIKASLDPTADTRWTSNAVGALSEAVRLVGQGKDDIHVIHGYRQLANPPVLCVLAVPLPLVVKEVVVEEDHQVEQQDLALRIQKDLVRSTLKRKQDKMMCLPQQPPLATV